MHIKEYRKKRKLTQAEMADMIGVKQGTYSRYENGKSIPDKDEMIRIMEVTNKRVTANDFYGVM